MTDLSKIKEEFITLSSLGEEDAGKYQSLIEMECEYINSLLKSSDDENNSCVIFLCAAKAYYRYMLTNQSDGITSFKAGDVSYSLDTSSALENARAIYNFALEQCASLIKNNHFAFVMLWGRASNLFPRQGLP